MASLQHPDSVFQTVTTDKSAITFSETTIETTDIAVDSALDMAVVGAGPCGLAVAVAARKAGLSCAVFDRGCIVSGIAGYPTYMTFFSTAERIAIGGVPFLIATEKPGRRDALAYYRGVAKHFDLDVRQYQSVESLEPSGAAAVGMREADVEAGDRSSQEVDWTLHTRSLDGIEGTTRARAVVVATGYFGRPVRLGVPGEELPHVRHGYIEGHYAWNQKVVVVGGGNSAVDAALDMYRAGAHVTIVHFLDEIDPNVKPWVRPEIEARIRDGKIHAMYGSRVESIEPDFVNVRQGDKLVRVPAAHVYTMTGYLPETSLLEQVGVPIDPHTGVPAHDPETMATPVPGIYLAGVITSGLRANRIFIENGRDHGDMIVAGMMRDAQ